MYGTRDAPAVWQRLVHRILSELGFNQSRTAACVYVHHRKGFRVVAHVDDFLVTGPRPELESLRYMLQQKFEVDGDVLGTGLGEKSEGRFLGRIIGCTSAGLEWEADPKLVRAMLSEFEAENGCGFDTPGVKDDSERSGTPMTAVEAKRFRKGTAILNYLSQDRVDVAFASKEASRCMADLQVGDEKALIRAVRYLARFPRLVSRYDWQEPVSQLVVFTDSDWGGCVRSRRSTSGGAMMHGRHLISHWSRTQQLVALSCAEAELNAAVKAGQGGLGVSNLLAELGVNIHVQLQGDSSANHGIITRQATGKVKHLSVRQLWLQEQTSLGRVSHIKIPRLQNGADALTHHWSKAEGELLLPTFSVIRPTVYPQEGVRASAGARPEGGSG